MANGGGGSSLVQEAFFARLRTDLNGVSDTLTLLPYKGNTILVNRKTVAVPDAGLTVDVADNLIDAAGADAGAAGGANTLYYVYVANALSPFSPSSIRLSSTAPSLVNGVKYLGSTGNAINWRFVGWVYLNATPKFESSVNNRLIVNYYNRLRIQVGFICPGYVDDNTQSLQVVAVGGQTNWTTVNGGTGERGTFISNGEDDVEIQLSSWTNVAAAGVVYLGVALDGVYPTVNVGLLANAFAVIGAASCSDDISPAEGFHTLDMVYATSGANTFALFWDEPRYGAAADPKLTGYCASIMA